MTTLELRQPVVVPNVRPWRQRTRRSEEHTSELQSQSNLVCRLLLEKKNIVLHLLEVKLDSLANEAKHFLARLARGNTTRQIRHIGSETGPAALDDDGVPHEQLTLTV